MAEIFKHTKLSDDIVYLGQSLETTPEPQPLESATMVDAERAEHACKAAFEAGYTQGFGAGATNEREKTDELGNTFKTLLENIPVSISEHRMQLANEIADIVFTFAQQFFVNQQQDKDAITYQVTQIIKQLNDKQIIHISLHPSDLASLHIDLTKFKQLCLIPDKNLSLGGCIVKSEHGVFDASIERQIDNLKQVLLQMRQDAHHLEVTHE